MIAVLFEVTPLPGQEERYFEIAAMLCAHGAIKRTTAKANPKDVRRFLRTTAFA